MARTHNKVGTSGAHLDDWTVRNKIIGNEKPSKKYILRFMAKCSPDKLETLLWSRELPKEAFDEALKHKDWRVRAAATRSTGATEEQKLRALDDPDPKVRKAALENGSMCEDVLKKAMRDPNFDVKMAASEITIDADEYFELLSNSEIFTGRRKKDF